MTNTSKNPKALAKHTGEVLNKIRDKDIQRGWLQYEPIQHRRSEEAALEEIRCGEFEYRTQEWDVSFYP